MRPANEEAKARCRAAAAKCEGDANQMRREYRKLATRSDAFISAGPTFKKACALRRAQDFYTRASRAYYEAAFEFGLGNDAKGVKRQNDAAKHVAAAVAAKASA